MASHHGIPDSYWLPVPCGHPPDPVALWDDDGVAVCHCGDVLAAYDRPLVGYVPAGAPGPVLQCLGCGCHVAIPPFGSAAGTLAKEPVPGLPLDAVYEDAYLGPVEAGASAANYDQLHAWALDTLRQEHKAFVLVCAGNMLPLPDSRGGYDVSMVTAHWSSMPPREQVAWLQGVQRVVQDALDRLARYGATGDAQHGTDSDLHS